MFDALVGRGAIVVHHSEVERLAALTNTLTNGGGLVMADTREQVAVLNAAIRDQRLTAGHSPEAGSVVTGAGEQIGVGDRAATRRNDRDLGVANRDCWTVTGVEDDGALRVSGRNGDRTLPAPYVHRYVELAYATTVHGAQGDTVGQAQLLIGETTCAAAAYVGMTRGRERNTAHLVAEGLEEARAQWVEVFSRDRADLGPRRAADRAAEDLERYGPQAPTRSSPLQAAALHERRRRPTQPPGMPGPLPSRGIGF